MPTRIDCEYEVLKAAGYPGTISEKELAWLKANGAVTKNLLDAWSEFLTARGFTVGTVPDRQRAWLLAYVPPPEVGQGLTDLFKWFWCVRASATP